MLIKAVLLMFFCIMSFILSKIYEDPWFLKWAGIILLIITLLYVIENCIINEYMRFLEEHYIEGER